MVRAAARGDGAPLTPAWGCQNDVSLRAGLCRSELGTTRKRIVEAMTLSRWSPLAEPEPRSQRGSTLLGGCDDARGDRAVDDWTVGAAADDAAAFDALPPGDRPVNAARRPSDARPARERS